METFTRDLRPRRELPRQAETGDNGDAERQSEFSFTDPATFGPFTLDPQEQTLTRRGLRCRLQPQPFRILMALVARAGRLVTREDLRREIWGEDHSVDYEHGLNFAINQIRTVLGDTARAPRFIETVPRAGYRFIAPVSYLQPSVEEREKPVDFAPEDTSRRPRWRGRLLALAAGAILIALGVWLGARRSSETAATSTSLEGPTRLAVIPFAAVGAEPTLADGATLDLIAALGRIAPRDLTVIGRRSMTQFRGTPSSASEIGRQLQVAWVVEGQVRQQGHRIRVDAMIVDTADDSVAWSWGTSRAAADLRATLQEVAARIAQRLLPAGSERVPSATALPLDPAVYKLFAEARWNLSSGRSEGRAQAIDDLREVVRRAPSFSAGHAALASVLVQNSFGSNQRDLEEAWTVVETARALDPTSSEAYFALGLLEAFGRWDLQAGRQAFARAIELDPSNAQAVASQGVLATIQGDPEEAKQMADLAVKLDPLSGDAWTDAGYGDYLSRRFELARDRCERSLAMGSTHRLWSSLCLLNASQSAEDWPATDRAVRRLREFLDLDLDAGGQNSPLDRVRDLREEIILTFQAHNEDQVLDFFLAAQNAALGRREEALGHLERSLKRRDLFLPLAMVDPVFDLLRSDPRFRRILAAIKNRGKQT